jgi:hypothetical protein
MVKNVIRYVGEPNVPYDTADLRANSLDLFRWMGTPVIIKHRYNPEDVASGIATQSPNWSDVYKQTRGKDPLSYGVGFVSVETSPDEFVTTDGRLTTTANTGILAPRYRGYGPGYLTYVVFPDASEDIYKPNEIGVLQRIQRAQVQMGWYPEVNDNDLIIVTEIDDSENVIATHERFLARMTNPVSLHGFDQGGRREYTESFGNRRIINQQFELDLLPENHILYNVETDR